MTLGDLLHATKGMPLDLPIFLAKRDGGRLVLRADAIEIGVVNQGILAEAKHDGDRKDALVLFLWVD